MITPFYKHCAAAFCLDFSLMVGHTAMPFFIFKQLGGDVSMSGTVAALLSITYAVVCIFGSGIAARAKNGLTVAAWGALWFGVFFAAACLARSPFLFTALAMCGYMGVALAWPAMHAWIGAEADMARRGRLMSFYNISWSVGLTLGSLLSGFLYDMHFQLPFVLVLLFGGAAFAILLSQPHEHEYFGLPQDNGEDPGGGSESHLYATWLACIVGWGLLGASRSVFPKRLDELVEAGQLVLFFGDPNGVIQSFGAATLFSVLAFGLTLTSAAIFFVMGNSLRWRNRYWIIVLFQLLAAGSFWVLGTTHSLAIMFLCYGLVGANTYVAFFASLFYSLADMRKKHRRAAINEGLVGTGNFIGSMVFGWAAVMTDLSTPFVYAPIGVAVLIAIELILLRHGLRKSPSPYLKAKA